MTVVACTDFPEPNDLKEILELLEKLVTAHGVSGAVLGTLEKEAQKYFKDSDIISSLGSVFTNAQSIRGSIISDTHTYPKYSSLDRDHGKHNDCVPRALKKCLPKAFAALYYLYFMGSQSLKETIKGGKWHDYACNGNDYDYRSSGSKVDLYLWLIDQKGENSGLVKRGFTHSDKHSFTSNTGETVATVIANIIKHDTPGDLQNVLLYLLLACPWHDSLLGHACLFLSTFCDQVQDHGENFQKYFSSSDFEELKSVCLSLKENLKPFIVGSLPLSAVCHQNGTLYSAVWNPEAIPLYVKWLKENLNGIIESLQSMSGEASHWTQSKVQGAETAGPFRFGFVFKGSWDDHTFKSQLPSKISPLTGSGSGFLVKLKE
ncbi:secreted antigen 1, partial [Babesia divergens]